MFYGVGRLLQLVGLILLPVAISGELAGKLELKTSLVISGIGVAAFYLGWLVQKSGN